MYVGTDFDPIEPGETDVFTFELTPELGPGQTIAAPVWTCMVAGTVSSAAADPSPGARLIGAATVSATTNPVTGAVRTFTNQKVAGMLDGNLYRLEATVQTSDGRTLQRYAHVRCKAAA